MYIYIYVYTVVAIPSTHPSRDPMGVFLDPGLLPESINFNEPSPRALDLPVPVTLVAAGGSPVLPLWGIHGTRSWLDCD